MSLDVSGGGGGMIDTGAPLSEVLQGISSLQSLSCSVRAPDPFAASDVCALSPMWAALCGMRTTLLACLPITSMCMSSPCLCCDPAT